MEEKKAKLYHKKLTKQQKKIKDLKNEYSLKNLWENIRRSNFL